MTTSLTQAFRKNAFAPCVFILIQACRYKRYLCAFLLLMCGCWPLNDQRFKRHLQPEKSQSFSSVVVGVLTTQEYFNSRFGYQLSTFLREILDKDGNVVVSIERGVVPFQHFKQRMKLADYPVTGRVALFESRCPIGYNQLLCRTVELLRTMSEAHPNASWYIRIDDDTLLFPKALHSLLLRLNPRHSLAVGSPSFYFCTSALKCTHRRYPGLPWKEINQVVSLIRGGAGYILSRSVILWIISNEHEIATTAKKLRSYAEDLVIFFSLRKLMKQVDIVQARSFHFERPEVALRFSPFHSTSDTVAPVSFHMHHNLVNGYFLYKNLHELQKEVYGRVGEKKFLVDDVPSRTLARIRSQVSLKIVNCVQGAKSVKSESRNWYSELRESLVDMFLVRLVKQLDEMLGDYGCRFLLDTLEEAVEDMRTVCVPETRETNEEKTSLERRNLSAKFAYGSQVPKNRKNLKIREARVERTNGGLQTWTDDEQLLEWSHMGFAETIDLLVDCEEDGKKVRHLMDAERKRKKSLWEWNAVLSVRGYAISRTNGSGLFWKMRHLEYISHLKDSWMHEEGEPIRNRRDHIEVNILDLVLYLRRGRVVLTEIREHHLALSVLRIPHVYIRNESEEKSKAKSLCAGDLPFVKCVSNLTAATEVLAEFLLGASLLNYS